MITPTLQCDGCGFLWPLPTSPTEGIQPGELHAGCESAGAFRFAKLRPIASVLLEDAIRDFEAAENLAATLEEQAKDARANAKYIGETILVSYVGPDELNDGVRLADGSEYVFEQKLKCSVADGQKTAAYEYLEDKKAGGLLRRYITLSFGKDSMEQVKTVRAMLARVLPSFEVGVKVGAAPEGLRKAVEEILKHAGLNIEVTESVELPGATMASFVRKELKAGREVPPAFGVYNPMRPIAVAPLSIEEDERQHQMLMDQLRASVAPGGSGGTLAPITNVAGYGSIGGGGAGTPSDSPSMIVGGGGSGFPATSDPDGRAL